MDFSTLPSGYTALANLKTNQTLNALVLVVSSNLPKPAFKGDFMVTCFVADHSLPEGEVLTNIFRTSSQIIPKLEPGTLVEFQDVKAQLFNKRQQICANNRSKVLIHKIDATSQLDVSCSINLYLKSLASWWETKISTDSTIGQLVASQVSDLIDLPEYVPGQKFHLFQSVKPDVYVDLAVEVIKILPRYSKSAEMIVTDYTENKLAQLSSRSIERDLMTSGRRLDFTVTLWDEHAVASCFLNAKEGTRLLLLNCKAKLSKSGVLEMAIHGEGKTISRKIFPLSDELSLKISA